MFLMLRTVENKKNLFDNANCKKYKQAKMFLAKNNAKSKKCLKRYGFHDPNGKK